MEKIARLGPQESACLDDVLLIISDAYPVLDLLTIPLCAGFDHGDVTLE